jgi:hypothetical protein
MDIYHLLGHHVKATSQFMISQIDSETVYDVFILLIEIFNMFLDLRF